ncbi:MAG: hypothetical protein VX640_01665 [Pseudomonadota bacterium]|nr:hypothetical protein [Pseudomonadota bacterium]
MAKLIAWALVFLFAGLAETSASQEGALAFEEFRYASSGVGDSGPVEVEGRRNKNGAVSSLIVRFMGVERAAPAEILEKVPKGANAIQVSYEHNTVYVVLQTAWVAKIAPYHRIAIAFHKDEGVELLNDYGCGGKGAPGDCVAQRGQ